MNVAYLIGSLERGGAETLLLDEFKHWERAPFRMFLVHRKKGDYEEDFHEICSNLRNGHPGWYYLNLKKMSFYRYANLLRNWVDKNNIDVIHAQYWLDAIVARIALVGKKIPIVLTFHGFFLERGIQGLLTKLSMMLSNKIVFVSEYEKLCFQERFGKIINQKGVVIYNGINFDKITNATSLQNINSKKIKLVMVGNFVGGRSQMIVLKGLNELIKKGIIDWEFYFVGRKREADEWRYDECVRYCQENALEQVHFLGGRGDVPSILKSMDGFVYSTTRDTFGIAVVEAIASGLPVVANDFPALKEINQLIETEIKPILFYSTGDVDDCAEKIETCLENIRNNGSEVKKISLDNAVRIQQKLDIDGYIQNLNELYKTL